MGLLRSIVQIQDAHVGLLGPVARLGYSRGNTLTLTLPRPNPSPFCHPFAQNLSSLSPECPLASLPVPQHQQIYMGFALVHLAPK